MSTTKAQVFIIETLKFEDEQQDMFEGHRISHMLSLSGKECRYVYIRTKIELREVLQQFVKSKFRYLHLSCHADRKGMDTTLDRIPFEELVDMLVPCLARRRLFLSACSMSCRNLATQLLPRTNCFSILGPSMKVDAADAAIFWASFYHKMFRINSELMQAHHVLATATPLARVFSIPLNYFRNRDSEIVFHRIRPSAKKWIFEKPTEIIKVQAVPLDKI